MFLNTRKISWVDVDTLENKYPFTLFSFGHRGNDRLTSNLMKIGVAPKAATLSGSLSLLSSQRKFTRTGDSLLKRFFEKRICPVLDIERLPENQTA
jgi:hypothetical protein